jgi:hypothetical protein
LSVFIQGQLSLQIRQAHNDYSVNQRPEATVLKTKLRISTPRTRPYD